MLAGCQVPARRGGERFESKSRRARAVTEPSYIYADYYDAMTPHDELLFHDDDANTAPYERHGAVPDFGGARRRAALGARVSRVKRDGEAWLRRPNTMTFIGS